MSLHLEPYNISKLLFSLVLFIGLYGINHTPINIELSVASFVQNLEMWHFVILRQGCEVSIKELDTLLSMLSEKKRKLEQEEAERNMQILLDFLQMLRKQKVDELNEVCHCFSTT